MLLTSILFKVVDTITKKWEWRTEYGWFIGKGNSDTAEHWWLRNGTSDNHTSQTVMINLASGLENEGKRVNTWLFWDGGHCADDNPEGFIDWVGHITDYKQ